MNERLKTHSKTQKKSVDLVSNKLRIGVFQRYQMKCKSVSKKSPRYTPTAELQYRIPDQPSLDGNTVDMDRERTQFADNSLQYQMSLSALSGQIKGMMNVLQSGN